MSVLGFLVFFSCKLLENKQPTNYTLGIILGLLQQTLLSGTQLCFCMAFVLHDKQSKKRHRHYLGNQDPQQL